MRLVFVLWITQLVSARWIDRRLSENMVSNNCDKWGFVASLVCPEILHGNLRMTCSLCPSIVVNNFQNECYGAFPGRLCEGDCSNVPTGIFSCDTPECQSCWSTQTVGCTGCDASCFTHAHCYDPNTQTFSEPPANPRDSVITNCDGMMRAYLENDCCTNSTSSTSIYIRV